MICLNVSVEGLVLIFSINLIISIIITAIFYDEFSYESSVKSFFWPITLIIYPFRLLHKLNNRINELDMIIFQLNSTVKDESRFSSILRTRIDNLENKKRKNETK